jgi:fucose 4-O-acetylase-like acetyltransferase
MTDTVSRHDRAAAISAATPATRDRYVDLLRALSILVVVIGHWLMAAVYWKDGRLGGTNVLTVAGGVWVLTWILQVMPLFFFVGGFSNATGWASVRRRGEGYAEYLAGRIRRLMAPTAVFIGAWVVLANIGVRILGPEFRAGADVIAKPLWFIGIYLVVVTVAPPMLALHERYRAAVPLALASLIVVVDIVRFTGGIRGVGYVNFPAMWLLVHQLGFFYADGTFARVPRSTFAAAAATGVAGLVMLTSVGPYPKSTVGVPGDRFSNMDPPTLVILALSVWLIGLSMTLREPVTRWLAKPKPWAAVVGVNSVIMSVFLWHLTALLIGIAVLFPLGFPQPQAATSAWWLIRPFWVVALGLVLFGLVKIIGRFERPPAGGSPAAGGVVSFLAMAALVGGILAFAQTGFTSGPKPAGIPVGPLLEYVCVLAGASVLGARRSA